MYNKKNNLEDKVPFGKAKLAKSPFESAYTPTHRCGLYVYTGALYVSMGKNMKDTSHVVMALPREKEWDGGGGGNKMQKDCIKMMLFYLCKIISWCIFR